MYRISVPRTRCGEEDHIHDVSIVEWRHAGSIPPTGSRPSSCCGTTPAPWEIDPDTAARRRDRNDLTINW